MGYGLPLAIGIAYLVGVRAVPRRWPASRTAAFLAGAVVLAAATTIDGRTFTADVVEHTLIGMVAPPLLALGAPVTLALQALNRTSLHQNRLRTALHRALHSRALAIPVNPVVGWTVFTVSLFVLYLTPLYDATTGNELLHDAVHLHFLLAGMAWAWPVLNVDPVPRRMPHAARVLSTALAIPLHAFLGLALMTSGDSARQQGGGVLWLAGDAVLLAVLAWLVVQWANDDDRRAAREDRLVSAATRAS